MRVWTLRAAKLVLASALTAGVFFAFTYLMVCEFSKEVE